MGISLSKMLLSVGAGGAATLLIYSLWKIERPRQNFPILGLRNCGNSCFLNAILQALASCHYIISWLKVKDETWNYMRSSKVDPMESYQGLPSPLVAAMLRGLMIINKDIEGDDYRNSGKVPGDVLAGLRHNGQRIGVQQEQDAFELFMLVVMAINKELETSVKRQQTGTLSVLTDGRVFEEPPLPWSWSEEVIPPVDLSVEGGEWAVIGCSESFKINDRIYSKRQIPMEFKMDYRHSVNFPFRTLVFTQMQCIVCMTKTKMRIEPLDALTLNMPPPDTSQSLSLHNLLIRYFRPTLVHNVDCEQCTKNRWGGVASLPGVKKVQSSYLKFSYVGKLPQCLCIHLPRCTWTRRGLLKRIDFVSFPDRMNLGMLKRMYDKNAQHPELDAYKVFKQGPDTECSLRRFWNSEYRLVAVVSHVGSMVDSGHFITFRKVVHKDNENLSTWYYVSDDVVQAVPINIVLACRAYMLFYERA